MDSVILGWKKPLRYFFPELLNEYVPPPAVVVDLASGYQEFYKILKQSNGNTLLGQYKFIFGDVRNLGNNDLICDIKAAPLKDSIADAVVFDPPYASSTTHYKKDQLEEKFTTIGKRELIELLKAAHPEICRILRPGGTLIFKIGDRHKNKVFLPMHSIAPQIFNHDLEYYDIIIYRGIMSRPRFKLPFASKVHSYFMMFKKPLEASRS